MSQVGTPHLPHGVFHQFLHSCGSGYNRELLAGGDHELDRGHLPECPQTSQNNCQLEQVKGIEVKNIFKLHT